MQLFDEHDGNEEWEFEPLFDRVQHAESALREADITIERHGELLNELLQKISGMASARTSIEDIKAELMPSLVGMGKTDEQLSTRVHILEENDQVQEGKLDRLGELSLAHEGKLDRLDEIDSRLDRLLETLPLRARSRDVAVQHNTVGSKTEIPQDSRSWNNYEDLKTHQKVFYQTTQAGYTEPVPT